MYHVSELTCAFSAAITGNARSIIRKGAFDDAKRQGSRRSTPVSPHLPDATRPMRSKANITDADLARVQEAPLVPHLGHAEDADHDSERGHRSGTEQHTAAADAGAGEAPAALDMAAAHSGPASSESACGRSTSAARCSVSRSKPAIPPHTR